MLHIIHAEYISDYKIKVSFSDGETGVADFEKCIKHDPRKKIRELEDLEKFRDFGIVANTITWVNGVDFAPEFVKEQVVL